MKIAIDLTAMMPVSTGTDVYMENLVRHLGKVDKVNSYRIYVNLAHKELFKGSLPDNFIILSRCLGGRMVRLLFQQIWLPFSISFWQADVLHSPSFLMPYFRGRQKHLLTVQDMTFFLMPHCHNRLRKSNLFKYMVRKSILRADMLHAPSESTKQDMLGLLPQVSSARIQVIPLGFTEEFRMHSDEDITRSAKRLGLPSTYILHVGTLEPRKNIFRLVESYKRLLKKKTLCDLVLVGAPGWGSEELLDEIKGPILRDRVHWLGHISQEDLPLVYAAAKLFVYPSLYEGFGLPPLEAMACGVPVITSRNSSLGELYAEAALLVDTDDVNALTNAMYQMLFDDMLWSDYRRRGLQHVSKFSWNKTASDILKCYADLMEGNESTNN